MSALLGREGSPAVIHLIAKSRAAGWRSKSGARSAARFFVAGRSAFLPRRQFPKLEKTVRAAGQDVMPVGQEDHGPHAAVAVAFVAVEFAACLEVPQSGGAIICPRDGPVAVWRHRHGIDSRGMTEEDA